MRALFHPRLLEAWEAYQTATAIYVEMQQKGATGLFEQALAVRRLERDFSVAYDRFGGSPAPLRIVGGTDA